MHVNRAAFAIIVGGLIAGIFDITYAITFLYFQDISAVRVLQSVASGILGTAAYERGLSSAGLGLLLHFFIAFSAAAIFYVLSRKIHFLIQHAFLAGILYGTVIYLVMYLIVLPMSAYPHKINFSPSRVAINLFVHMFLIGLPISLAVRKATVS